MLLFMAETPFNTCFSVISSHKSVNYKVIQRSYKPIP